MIPRPVAYDHDEKGNILLPAGAPFDGKLVLIKLGKGWCEAYWAPGERHETLEGVDYDGFCWVCLDDEFQVELDDAQAWCPLPGPVTEAEAVAAGYAGFNDVPHLCVDIPDGNHTITARSSDGRRVTFSFLTYQVGEPPQCVDIQYHDRGKTVMNGTKALPVTDFIGFGPQRPDIDSRKEAKPVTLLTVLMDERVRPLAEISQQEAPTE